MPHATQSSASTARRFIWLAVAIVVFGIAWTAGWSFLAGRIETHVPLSLQRLAGPQAQAECTNAEVRGYPFRFGLFCDRIAYSNDRTGVDAASGALRSAAQFYRPDHIVSEIDGPLSFSGKAAEGRIDWQSLQSSIHATPLGLERGSIEGRNISFDIDSSDLSARFGLGAERLTAHARRNGPDADVAVYADGVRSDLLGPAGVRKLTLEATLKDRADILEAPFLPPQGILDIALHRVLLELEDGASMEIAGPLRIGEDGRISGDVSLTIRNQQALADLAARFVPEAGDLVGDIAPMLGAFDTVAGDDAITVPLTIRSGAVSMAFIPLGRIPAL